MLFYSASGGYIPTDCKEPTGDPLSWVSEEWAPEKVGITSKYAANYTHLKALLNEWYEDTSSAERFAGPLGDKYLVRTSLVSGLSKTICFFKYELVY